MLGKIVQQVSHYSGQDEMIQKLRSNIEALICQAADINKELEEAEFRSGKKRKHEVENWLRNVEWTKNKVQNLDQEIGGRKISSLLLGNRVDKLNGEIAELREQGRFPRGLLFDMRETEEPLVTSKLIGQAFEQNLKEIWACLMDDEVLRIGIYGMGGVGKSSLAAHTYNRLLKKSESVYWITVSQDFSIGKLQDDIAKTLKLEFSNEDEKKKAAKLSRALTRRKNCILILDDVWKQIPLDIVGIPNSVNGCKVILTTRLFDVCRKMDCQANFKVEPLSEEEAWDLFRGKLGQHTALSPEVKNIAMSVAAKCSGLPLGIITMAASMRGVNDICEWRSVFEELKVLTMGQEDMENEVFPILKFSYSRLTDQDLQLCFLYCALYPEDCKIERNELIGYFVAEKLIDKWKSWQAKFDMGNTMLNKLERSCLLESCKDNGGNRCVMMHDLIRDMALKITNECHPRFMVKAGLGLKEIPDEQEWVEDLDKVSLMKNEIAEIRCGQSLRCHKLSTLILKDNPLKRIANSFFECMHALQFLDLSENYVIVELPNSISNLENLTTLLLRRCHSLTYVPPLEKLTALRELDLSWTRIKRVPQGVDRLVNLENLNMAWTKQLELIPSGTLGKLSHLQHVRLHCESGPVKIKAKEFEGLKGLKEFVVQLDVNYGYNQLVKYLQRCEQPLKKYSLQLRRPKSPKFLSEVDKFESNYCKVVKLGERARIGEGENSILLPYDLQLLEIEGCSFKSRCLCDAFPSLRWNAIDLKYCGIRTCSGIECIESLSSSSTSSHNDQEEAKEASDDDLQGESRCVPFQNLETLYLYKLRDFRGLCLGFEVIAPPHCIFSSLKKLYISSCPKIKSLFTPFPVDDEEGLGTSFFCNNDDDNHHDTLITLPKLRVLSVCNLPELKSMCEGKMVCNSIEVIIVQDCPKLKRLSFSLPIVNGQLSAPKALNAIKIDYNMEWWESLKWDDPNAKDVLQPFVRIYRPHSGC